MGGEGNDTISAGAGTGQDTIYGDTGSQTPAVAGNDVITGNAGDDLIYAGAGTNTINPGTGPGTQVFNPGVTGVAAYAETPMPEQDPELTAAATTAATLPTAAPNTGIWATLAGGTGSSLGSPTTNDGGPVIAAGATTRYVAWIDTASGVPAVYLATESGTAWGQLSGSAQGGGISGLLQAASEPAIALLASGQPVVAWTAQTPGASNIQLAEYNPAANGGAGAWVGVGNSLSAGGHQPDRQSVQRANPDGERRADGYCGSIPAAAWRTSTPSGSTARPGSLWAPARRRAAGSADRPSR